MSRAFRGILCSLTAVAFAAAAPAGEPDAVAASRPATRPAGFSIATYNILDKNLNLAEVVRSIRKAGADVVCLQEVNEAAKKYIRARLAKDYPHMHFHIHGTAGGQAFLSGVPLDKPKWVPPKHGMHGAYVAKVKLGGRTVQIMNAHLHPTLAARCRTMLELIRLQAACEAIREKEMPYFHAALEPNVPTIIAGDFNSFSTGRAPTHLKKLGYADSFASVTAEADRHPTWGWTLKTGIPVSFRLDYVFHTPDLRTLSSRVIANRKASDHDILVSRLNWKPKRATSRPAEEAVRRPTAAAGR